jgi:hypothetical protein
MVAHRVFRALAAALLAAGVVVGLSSSAWAVTVSNYTGPGIAARPAQTTASASFDNVFEYLRGAATSSAHP